MTFIEGLNRRFGSKITANSKWTSHPYGPFILIPIISLISLYTILTLVAVLVQVNGRVSRNLTG